MPKLLKTPFAIDAAEGFRTDIQESTGVAPNSATYQVGFPPVTMQSIASNGMPPKGSDLNGVLYDITDNLVFLTQGGGYGFDAAYATSIGGYPLNAMLHLANGDIVKSTVPNNSNDPNADMAGWVKANSASQIFDESGLSQQEINNKFTGARKVDLSYMKWPDGFDVSAILDTSLKLSQSAPLHLILPHGDFVASAPVSTGDTGKGIILDLNGSTIKPTVKYSSHGSYLIDLQSTTDFPAILLNGTVDGVNRKQNLFEYTNIADFSTDATNGVHMKAKYVGMSNFELLNLYGQTTKFFCEKADVLNVNIENCGGHWYVNDGYDMFGDLFYIGTEMALNGVVQGTFKNVTARAKHSDQYSENHQSGSPLTQIQYSRAGLVLENFGDTENTAYVSFENCDMRFVERGIHQEIGGITSHITFNNSRMDSCVLFGAYLTDAVNGYGFNSYFGFYGSAYNGSKGLSRAYGFSTTTSLPSVSNVYLNGKCTVEYFGQDDCRIFGTSGNLEANNTTFKNVTGLWAENSKVKLGDCSVAVAKHLNLTYVSWATSWDIKDTKIKYVGSDQVLKEYNDHIDFKLDNVEFDNIYLGVNSKDVDKFNNNLLIVNNDSTLNLKGSLWELRNRDGKVLHYPSILWGVSKQTFESGRYTYQKYQKPATGTLNIINDAIRELSKRVSLFLIVVKGHDDGIDRLQNISDVNYAGGYYVSLAKRDTTQPSGVKQLTPFTSVGSTDGAGYNLTIDANFDVTAYGTYSSWVHVAIVPVSEKDTLPFVPESII